MRSRARTLSLSLKEFSVPGVDVNLFDTKGLELDSREREVSRNSIIEEIKRRAKSSSEEEHMHVMWYCISNESKRIEDTEIAWIRDFSKYMPVIIVLTQTLDTEEELKGYLETELTGVVICQVLAKDRNIIGHVIPAHGLKVLINETMKILPEATQRAFTAAQKIKIEEKIKSARQFIQERLDSKGPFNYKNLGHIADTLPIGLDFIGKGAVYLYIAKDIMTLMGIPVDKNFLKFSKQAKPLIKSIVLPFVFFEGTKTVGKAAVKYGSEKIGTKAPTYLTKLLGKSVGKGNIIISPVVGLILGTFNRKVTEKIANVFIDVCSDFLRSKINYQELSYEEIMEILSKNMEKKMEENKDEFENNTDKL
ncbi:hypothetical protein NCCP28_35150 [Niallia sp. NCCP-28]|nr:hypothetical protein NCCP28_35150 [Niallia sp. NCCP-28]